ncbi:pilus assembly protein PilM [Thiohalocapsa marina]|uniref:Pilus assembly protein PilM n=1 Tax=Thiohalocapsa marina TaxID=424902 RepID=A0A5M8FRK1_9GAMM|nr:pilus assembly protein PilM [Thiohalocapsa marina]KAA6185515.1 pilus assembly protein PilM [Thiohalocapsa marina]
MFTLRRKPRRLLGIDIGASSVKLLELSQTTGSSAPLYRVEAFAIEPLPPTTVVDSQISDVEDVGRTIKRAVGRSGSRTKQAAVAVSGSAVITKTIVLPAELSDAEMEAQIQLEADQYIPYPLEEVNLDFDVLGSSARNPGMVDVLLAASRREYVDGRVAALQIAGLQASIVDIEAYALENAFVMLCRDPDDLNPDHTVAIADVAANTTSLEVLRQGEIVYTREQNFGGNQLLDDLQQRYGLNRDQALEQLQDDALPRDFADSVLRPFADALAQQLGRALQFFHSATHLKRIDRLILTGGPAGIAGIDQPVRQRLSLPVVVADPFAHMALAPGIDSRAIAHAAPSMMIATGLALRAFD